MKAYHIQVICVLSPNISLILCLASWQRDTPGQHLHIFSLPQLLLQVCSLIYINVMSAHAHRLTAQPSPEQQKWIITL